MDTPEISQEKENVFSSKELPTTPEIAKQGAEDYRRFIEGVTDTGLRQDLLNDRRLRGVFTGTTPEEGHSLYPRYLFFWTEGQISQVAEAFGQVGGNGYFLLVESKEDTNGEVRKSISFFNLKAVEHTMNNHKSIFPTHVDTKTMLEHNFYNWVSSNDSLSNLRRGLLSGYPLEDVQLYPLYCSIFSYLLDSLTGDDLEFFKQYGLEEASDGDMVRMGGILYKNFENISGSEIEFYLNQRKYRYAPHEVFVGFDKSRDEAYIQALNQIYTQSGIEEVGEELKREE